MSRPANSKSLWSETRDILTRATEVWSLLGARERLLLRLSLIPMVLYAAAQNAIPVLAGRMVDALRDGQLADVGPAGWVKISLHYILWIGFASLMREALLLARKQMVGAVNGRVERNLTIGLVSHLYRQSLQSLSKDHIGAVHARATRGIGSFIHFLRLVYREFLPALFSVVVALGYAFWSDPIIGFLLLIALTVALLLVAAQLKAQQGMFHQLSRSRDELDGTIIEQLEGMEYIRAANTINLEIDRIGRSADFRRNCDDRLSRCAVTFDALKSLNEWCFYLMGLVLAIYLAATGRIEIGEIITFLGLMTNMTSPLRDMHRILDDTYETSIRLQDVMMIMDELMDPSFDIDAEDQLTIVKRFGERRPAQPAIEFREPTIAHDVPLFTTDNLVVEYVSQDKRRRVLDGVSVRFELGETIGLAGASGSGKSTLLKVLLRLIPITAGTAQLGGVPIQNVSRDSLGRLVGYVSQNPFVFSGTIAENIAYGVGPVSREQIEAAARKAGIHEDILAMSHGYETRLLERGANVSGGQRQRFALARVFLKNPPILVLDEGTSALDNVSEQRVQQTLDDLGPEHTIILVAHRLSTLRSADRILVFDQGRIVQAGSMAALTEQPGVFRELMKAESH